MDKDKEYEVVALLGLITDTGDMGGTTIRKEKKVEITEAQLKTTCEKFTGTYLQTPPMYSAIKHTGRRLYELAREGKEEGS